MNSIFSELYTIEGRLGRIAYLWKMLTLLFVGATFIFVAALGAPLLKEAVGAMFFNIIMSAYFIFVASLFIFPPLALQIRRLHDIGLSGWLVWIPTVLCGLLGLVFGYTMGLEDALDMMSKAGGGICLVFILFLLVWPGEDGRNQYGQGTTSFYTSLNDSKREQIYKKASVQRTYEVVLREPMPEDSMYIFKHLKQEYRGIQKIVLPETRDKVSFMIIGKSALSERKIKKILHDLGVFTKRVKKKS